MPGIESVIKYRVLESKPGVATLSDGSIIVIRAAVIDVRHVERESSPFRLEFDADFTVGISLRPSDTAMREVSDRPVAQSPSEVREGWTDVEIVDAIPAREEILYLGLEEAKYIVTLEVEPLMAAKNTLYRTLRGTPLYVVRWVPKLRWRKAESDSGKQ